MASVISFERASVIDVEMECGFQSKAVRKVFNKLSDDIVKPLPHLFLDLKTQVGEFKNQEGEVSNQSHPVSTG